MFCHDFLYPSEQRLRLDGRLEPPAVVPGLSLFLGTPVLAQCLHSKELPADLPGCKFGPTQSPSEPLSQTQSVFSLFLLLLKAPCVSREI